LISVQRRGVDGLIGVFFHTSVKQMLPLVEMGMAIVRLEPGQKRAGSLPIDNLFVDSQAAVKAATRYLIEKGYRRIAMLGGTSGPARLRIEGYREALAEQGIAFDPALLSVNEFTEAGGYLAMQPLLATTPRPDAVFASNDMMALGALTAVKAAGLDIPRDLALIGFDDIPADRLVSPALTTVTQFQSRLGQRAAELLFERLNGHAPASGRSIEMPFEIVVRESA
jgi:LacI family transcriptional regulator